MFEQEFHFLYNKKRGAVREKKRKTVKKRKNDKGLR